MEGEWFPIEVYNVTYYDGYGELQTTKVVYKGTNSPWHGITDYILFGLGGTYIESVIVERVTVVADEYVRP